MSKYTTEVRYICETYAQLDKSEGYQSINGIIEKARDKVFNFDFPIYDESYRSVLESKILKHYYTREIGFETVGLWEHFLDMKMNEIMPYYNQLYKSALLNFNPLYDTDYTTTSNRDIGSNEKSTSHNTRTDNLKESTSFDNTRTDNLDESTSFDNTRTDNLKEATSFDNTRTDDLSEHTTEDALRTDNLKEQNVNNNTRTDNLTSKYDDKAGTEYGHVVDTTNTNDADSSDRYSETPQGSLQGVQELTYLTNARMKTDSTNGTGKETHSGLDSTYDDSTTLNTGTQKNEGGYTTDNTGSQKNVIDTEKANTGTQNETGTSSKDNTGTQNQTGTGDKKNTGTQNQAGTGNKDNTGTQDNDGNETKDFNSTDEYLEHVAGKRGTASYSELIREYRKTFLNIDMMVIKELSDLFMNLW